MDTQINSALNNFQITDAVQEFAVLSMAVSMQWLTGTYDPSTNLIYWPTGNPCPDYNGDQRKGDNLYSNSVIALDAQTGKLRWFPIHPA